LSMPLWPFKSQHVIGLAPWLLHAGNGGDQEAGADRLENVQSSTPRYRVSQVSSRGVPPQESRRR
jgi:hypothetical protein